MMGRACSTKVKSAIGPQQEQTDDLAAYVTMIVETHRELAREKGITLRFETDDESMPATYVPDYIHKVVSNLLTNAIKFTPEGGTVHASLHRSGDSIHFSVSDNGCGIAAEDLEHIWERYYRASSNMVRSVEGSGLGLAICKEILSLHKSDFGVDSTVGKGSTFWFKLDLVK